MSVQNSLKKPSFTKSVRGYTVREVDRYIEYVNERYSAVCRESADLKRKLTRLKLGFDRPEVVSEMTHSDITSEALIKQIEKLKRELSAECERHAEHIKRLVRDFESASDNAVSDNNDVTDSAAEGLKADAHSAQKETSSPQSETASYQGKITEQAGTGQGNITNVAENAKPCKDRGDEQSASLEISNSANAEVEPNEENKENEKTPAQLAEEIDFYSDSVHADGESFDPMVFAADAATRYARPSFASLMEDNPEAEKK